MDDPQQKPKPSRLRVKYEIHAVMNSFMVSEHMDFRTYLREAGLSQSIAQRKEAIGLADRKRRIAAQMEERVRMGIMAEPIRQRAEKKYRILNELEQSASALRTCIMNRVVADLEITRAIPGEPKDMWAARMKELQNSGKALRSGELMALAVAQKHVDELLRSATGLQDFDWEHEQKKAEMVAKANKLEIEIVQTSGARQLDQLPHADEDSA